MTNINDRRVVLMMFATLLCAVALWSEYDKQKKRDKEEKGFVPRTTVYECRSERIDQAYDSMLVSNSMPLTNVYADSVKTLRDSVSKMEFQNSLAGNLTNDVQKACKPIINSYMKKVCNLLKSNNIHYDSETINYVKDRMWPNGVFMAYDKNENEDCKWERLSVVGNIERLIDSDETNRYGYAKKNEIKEKIRGILVKDMCESIYKTRKFIESKYARYVPGGMDTINKNNVFCVEDSCFLDYTGLNVYNDSIFKGSKALDDKIEQTKQTLVKYENQSAKYEEDARLIREQAIWLVDSRKISR